MIVDSSAVIAILRQEAGAAAMSNVIADTRIKRMSAHGYLEVCMVIAGRRVSGAIDDIDNFIRKAGIEIIPFTAAASKIAVQAFIKYGKGRHPAGLNFGGCMLYALAKTEVMPLLFKGDDFRLTDVEPAI